MEQDFKSKHHHCYSWWSEATCRQHGVYPAFEERSELITNQRVVRIECKWTPQTLVHVLMEKGLPLDVYGQSGSGAISIDDWVQEMRTGQSELMETKHAVLQKKL